MKLFAIRVLAYCESLINTNTKETGRAIAFQIGKRKVRAPQDRVPDNVWEARAYGKCHRKYTARGIGFSINSSDSDPGFPGKGEKAW